jgi:hypothetical protein
MGDVMEEYREGRSRAWYWRQVLTAIVMSAYREIHSHGLLALRAVATGWAIIFLYRFFFRASAEMAFHRLEPGQGFLNWTFVHVYWYVIYTPVLALGGWMVARLHRQHQMAMVLAFAASKVLTFVPHFVTFAAYSFSSPDYVPYVFSEVWAGITTTAMILVGGIWRASPAVPQLKRSTQ